MEPSLQLGDVILVRKSDVYPHTMWRRWTSSTTSSSSSSDSSQSSSSSHSQHEDALKVLAYDTASGRPIGDPWTSRTWLKPPTIRESGCVIVHRAVDAQKYPTGEYRVRRVVGLGGQICRVSNTTTINGGGGGGPGQQGQENAENYWQTPHRWTDRIVRVPPFALWVEGDATDIEHTDIGNDDDDDDDDNRDEEDLQSSSSSSNKHDKIDISTSSIRTRSSCGDWSDSRVHGAVCKNNVIGIAERIVWPPSRWGKIIPPPPSNSDDATMTSRLPRAWWL